MASSSRGTKRDREAVSSAPDTLFDAESSASESEAPPAAKLSKPNDNSPPSVPAAAKATQKPIAAFFKPRGTQQQRTVASMFLKKPTVTPAVASPQQPVPKPPAAGLNSTAALPSAAQETAAAAASSAAAEASSSSQGSDDTPEDPPSPPPTGLKPSDAKSAAGVTAAPAASPAKAAAAAEGAVLGSYHPLAAVADTWGVGQPVPFRALARTLAGVEAISGRHAIQELVCNLFRSIIATSPSDLLPAVYLCSSKLAPEVEGMELGMGEALLTKAICQTTGRQPKDVKAALKEVGDLGLVAEQSRAKQATLGFAAKPKPLLLRDVFKTFKDIAGTSGKSSQDAKLRLIKSMLVKASGDEAEPRYIIRGLQGKFRVGLAQKSVLTALAQAITITPPNVPDGAQAPVKGGEGGSFAACLDSRVGPSGKPRSEEKVASELAEADDTLKAVFSELPSFDLIVPALLRGGVAAARQECQLTPGMPVTPMLAKPTKGVGEVLTRLEGIAFTSEWKYDGERAQVHKMPGGGAAAATAEGGGHRIFSRNHEETTGKYPDLAMILSDAEHAGGDNWTPLTPSVKDDPVALEKVMADDVDAAIAASQSAYEESLKIFPAGSVQGDLSDFIIDGEVIAYDPDTDALLPFQRLSNRARKNVTLENVKVPVVYAAFDLLYLHGKSLLQVPLEVRRTLLKRFFKEVPGKFRFAVGYDTFSGDTDALRAQLDAAVEGHCEGLMVKTLRDNATYEPSRRSLNWLKLKKDYMDGLTDSLDLVVIAAWHGKGKRTGTYGAYLLACYDEEDGEYQAITKVGTGFSDEALAAHTATFNGGDSNLVRSERPRNVRMSPNFRSVPDAWFEPKVVWEVKAADLSISPVYTAAIGRVDANKGIALRFPRFLRVRDDKSAEQATNSAQVESMYRAQPLAGGSAVADDDEDGLGQYAVE